MKKLLGLLITLFFAIPLLAQDLSPEDHKRVAQVKAENQWCADLGNGYYKNPIVPGAAGNILALKVGKDYYMANNSGNTYWFLRSRDLVNWKPVKNKHTIPDKYSTIWAEDIAYFNGKFHIYMPIRDWDGKKDDDHQFGVFVISSESIDGPWSEPVRVDNHYTSDPWYSGIDPGFIMTPEGKKYLYLDHGYMFPLNDEGNSSTEPPRKVYEGWEYPEHWVVICKCLEGAKLFYKDGYYYMGSAIGGDGNTSTSEMGIIARSTSPEGPWEESPYNPIVHTYSYEDPWWDLGHATILEGPEEGTWYLLVGGQPSKYNDWGMGQQLVMLPVEFTEDGWPVIKDHYDWNDLIPMPKGENIGGGMPLSDDFSGELGVQWHVDDDDLTFIKCGGGELVLSARGENDADGISISMQRSNPSYEVEVEVECGEGVVAGLVMPHNSGGRFGSGGEGLKFDGETVSYNIGAMWRTKNTDVPVEDEKVLLRIRAYKGDVSFFCSTDGGENWKHFQNGFRGGRGTIKLFAAGKGEAIFRNFKYIGIPEF